MAQRKHKWAAVMVLVIVLLASCSMDIFASGSPESTGTGSSGTSGGTYSSSSTYSNAVTAQLDGENLYPSTYSEEDYTVWATYDFGTEYVYNVETMSWVGDNPVEAGVITDKTKAKNADTSLNIVNNTDSAISIRFTGTNGNSICIPLAGYYSGTTLQSYGISVIYWTNERLGGYDDSAKTMVANKGSSRGSTGQVSPRCQGMYVRAVKPK